MNYIPILTFLALILLTYLYAKWYEKQGYAKTDKELLKKDREKCGKEQK